mgnify:CR=1 FL=1
MFKFLKKKATSEIVENKPQLEEAPIELRPCYTEGYDESSNTIVRLVGKAKSDKAYKVNVLVATKIITTAQELVDILERVPKIIDAVEVIRCKDCIYFYSSFVIFFSCICFISFFG